MNQAQQQNDSTPPLLEGLVIEKGKRPGILDKLRTNLKEFGEVGFNKEDDLNLHGEVQDRYDRLINNKTDYSAPMTFKEKVIDAILKNKLTTRGHFPIAADMYADAMKDFSRARKNPHAEILDSMDVLDESIQKALLNYGVKSDSRGVHYDEKSLSAQKFAKSKQLKEFFAENEEAIKKGEIKEHSFNFGINDSLAKRENADRYASLQHAKIINPHFDENGNMRGTLIDNYDFEHREVKDILNFKNMINNHGYNMQQKGNLENYFTTFDINSKPDWYYNWLKRKHRKK